VIKIFFILLFEKAQMEDSNKVVISIQIQRGPFSYIVVGAVGHEHFSSSEVGRDRKSLRTIALTQSTGCKSIVAG